MPCSGWPAVRPAVGPLPRVHGQVSAPGPPPFPDTLSRSGARGSGTDPRLDVSVPAV